MHISDRSFLYKNLWHHHDAPALFSHPLIEYIGYILLKRNAKIALEILCFYESVRQ